MMTELKGYHIKPLISQYSGLGAEELAYIFNMISEATSINTDLRMVAFISQTAHETGGFRWLTELGGRKYFAKYEAGTSIGRRLGNTESGDGFKYRGRGFIQLTGRYNFTQFQKHINVRFPEYGYDVIECPDLVGELPLAVEAAVFFWEKNHLNDYADVSNLRGLTKRINGGYNGYADREAKYNLLVDLIKGE